MSDYQTIPELSRKDADFAVIMEDDSLAPYVRAGGKAYLHRTAELNDGDTGLFFSREGLVFCQYCSDSRGTVFLFRFDRSRNSEDMEFPPGSELPVCYGRLLLFHTPELPQN